MAETKTYEGSCHCGNLRFQVTTDLARVVSCNCSICARSGYLLTFVGADGFKLLAGEGAQTDYQFGAKRLHHRFCTTCGIRCFSSGEHKGQAMYGVNVRTLEGVDLEAVEITKYDGRSL
jgi:hypothetical protein